MSLTSQREKIEMSLKEVRATPRVDYHCHVSMTESSDIENPTVISVTREEFLADLDEAGIEKARAQLGRLSGPPIFNNIINN